MSERITAVLDQIEAEQRQTSDTIPDNISIAELAEQVVRGKAELTPMQLRVVIELLPFHIPKLSAIGVGQLKGEDFASRLDRAVARSEGVGFLKLIEAKVIDDERS